MRKPIKLGAVLVALLLVAGVLLWYFELFPPASLAPVPAWRGIVPGQTGEAELVRDLGQPDKKKQRLGYLAYEYHNLPEGNFGWYGIEVWLQERTGRTVVVGLLRMGREGAADSPTLGSLALRRERPDKVSWALVSGERYLVWARQGTAVSTRAQRTFNWELPVDEVLLFEPMGVRHATLWTRWPWDYASGWSPVNLYARSDHGDRLPEDPYDWPSAGLP